MLAKFHLNYKALWGQTVCLLIYKSDVDFFEHDMFCVNEAEWIIEIPIDNTTTNLHYRYAVKEESKNLNFEFDGIRKLSIPQGADKIDFKDYWRVPNGDSPFDTIAFTDVFFKRKKSATKQTDSKDNFILQIRCPQMEPNRHFAIIGNQKSLGK